MSAVDAVVKGAAIGIFEPSGERLEQLGAWFEAEYPSLLRFAYFVTGNSTAAEDLVQDAFVRVYRAGGRVEEPTFKAYARKTILNLHRSAWRRSLRERGGARERGVVDAPDPAERDEVWRALLQLSPRQRAVVALRFYEDMSEKQIAAALGMSAGSVKKHTSRALDRLRGELGRQS